jgi:hypothetical protein
MLRTFFFAFAMVAVLAGTSSGAEPRGEPGSIERTNWCRSQFIGCVDALTEKCHKEYPNDAKKEHECGAEVWGMCDDAYGGNSDCRTRERPKPNTVPKLPGSPGQQAPVPRPSSPRPTKPPGAGSTGEKGVR